MTRHGRMREVGLLKMVEGAHSGSIRIEQDEAHKLHIKQSENSLLNLRDALRCKTVSSSETDVAVQTYNCVNLKGKRIPIFYKHII